MDFDDGMDEERVFVYDDDDDDFDGDDDGRTLVGDVEAIAVDTSKFAENAYEAVVNAAGKTIMAPVALLQNWANSAQAQNTNFGRDDSNLTALSMPLSLRNTGISQRPDETESEFRRTQQLHELGYIGQAFLDPIIQYDEANRPVYRATLGRPPELHVFTNDDASTISSKASDHWRNRKVYVDGELKGLGRYGRGIIPQWFWPTSIAMDWIARVFIGSILGMSAIAVLVVLLTSNRFDNEVRITTNYVTNGQQPTPANGLSFAAGNLKYGWVVLFALGMTTIGHSIILSGLSIVFSFILRLDVIERITGLRWVHTYQDWIVEKLMYGLDPSKFIMDILGDSVLYTLVLAVLGVSDINFLVIIYLAHVAFFYAFEFAHEYNVYKWARLMGYAAPYYIGRNAKGDTADGDLDLIPETTFGRDPDQPQDSMRPKVWTRRALAFFPQFVWRAISQTVSAARQMLGFQPAMSPETKAKYSASDAPELPREKVSQQVRRILEENESYRPYYYSKAALTNDFKEAINHGGFMTVGWFIYIGIAVTYFSYYFGPMHTTNWYVWHSWQHAAFWLTQLSLMARAVFNSARWWDETARQGGFRGVIAWFEQYIFTPLHHVFWQFVLVGLSFVLLANSQTGLIN